MRLILFLFIFFAPHGFSQASVSQENISLTLRSEWNQLREKVSTLEADDQVGGLYNEKVYGNVSLLWHVSEDASDDEVIRVFVEPTEGNRYFHVTYYKSHSIVPGQLVLRRFLGFDPNGWKNHTIDFNTGEYLGSQGRVKVQVGQDEQRILDEWGIVNF